MNVTYKMIQKTFKKKKNKKTKIKMEVNLKNYIIKYNKNFYVKKKK